MKRPGTKKYGTKKVLGLVLVMGVLAAGTYAFTAANTVEASKAGDGSSGISGFAVSNVSYDPIVATPNLLGTYTFDLDGEATYVTAKPLSTQVAWDTCTPVYNALLDTTSVTCTAQVGTTILSLDTLRVIATQ